MATTMEDSSTQTESKTEWIDMRIMRGDKDTKLTSKSYQVPYVPGMVVLDAVRWVQEHKDADLAVRWNCKAAHCGSCAAEINGMPRLLCKTRMDNSRSNPVTVSPMKAFPLIKDLVTDVSWNYEVAKTIPLFEPAHDGPFVMYQHDIERVKEFHRCIECFLCQDTCHVLREHQEFGKYYGPRFMVLLASYEMHPMDKGDRLTLIHEEAGIGMCNVSKCCTEVCPQGIRITDNAIIPLKERVADRYYDPLKKWLHNRLHNPTRPHLAKKTHYDAKK